MLYQSRWTHMERSFVLKGWSLPGVYCITYFEMCGASHKTKSVEIGKYPVCSIKDEWSLRDFAGKFLVWHCRSLYFESRGPWTSAETILSSVKRRLWCPISWQAGWNLKINKSRQLDHLLFMTVCHCMSCQLI